MAVVTHVEAEAHFLLKMFEWKMLLCRDPVTDSTLVSGNRACGLRLSFCLSGFLLAGKQMLLCV